jgi:hypothetical protein
MLRRATLLTLAAAVLAAVLSACAIYKEGSLAVTQPGGIGPVHVHFTLCSSEESTSGPGCSPYSGDAEAQLMVALAIPTGFSAPTELHAVPRHGGSPLALSPNREVAERVAEIPPEEEGQVWPPAGTTVVGYLSGVFSEHAGEEQEWDIDTDFALPAAADGGSYVGRFPLGLATGWRRVDASHPSSRAVSCTEYEGTPPAITPLGGCGIADEAAIGVSDLKIDDGPSPAIQALLQPGGQAQLTYGLDFASTVTGTLPSFALSATTTVPGGSATPTEASFAPGSVDPTSHRTSASRAVTVTAPARTPPGTYQVTLVATTASGGSASSTQAIVVPQPPKATIKLGKLKRNKAKGTATLTVTASATGKLTLSGKGLAKATKKVKVAGKPVKLKVRAVGKKLKRLRAKGKLKAKAKVSLRPDIGAAVSKGRALTLKLKAKSKKAKR